MRLWLATVALVGLVACRSNDARIEGEAGHRSVTVDDVRVELPDEAEAGKRVAKDKDGRRYSYRTKDGKTRGLYRVGNGVFVGPIVENADELPPRAYGAMWTMAGTRERRLALADEVARERGGAGYADLLAAAAGVQGAEWEEVRARVKTGTPEEAALAAQMFSVMPGAREGIAIARAARIVDLADPSKRDVVAMKTRDLVVQWEEHRVAAVMLRTVLRVHPEAAPAIACIAARNVTRSTHPPDEALLAEAAYLVFASADVTCEDGVKILEAGLDPLDHPSLRCNEKGPLGWASASKQDDPLCTKGEIAAVIAAEKQRPPTDLFTANDTRAPLFAYAALLAKGALPPAFVAAHERRRFALVQPKAPSCESDLSAGTPCACDEATVRQNAARNEPGHVVVGVCAFDVDVKEKRIANVVRFVP